MLVPDEDIEVRMASRPNPGGQQCGTYAGVFAIHKPTGISVLVDDERSQIKNRSFAVERLRQVVGIVGRNIFRREE